MHRNEEQRGEYGIGIGRFHVGGCVEVKNSLSAVDVLVVAKVLDLRGERDEPVETLAQLLAFLLLLGLPFLSFT